MTISLTAPNPSEPRPGTCNSKVEMLLPLTLRVFVIPEQAIASPLGVGTLKREPLPDL